LNFTRAPGFPVAVDVSTQLTAAEAWAWWQELDRRGEGSPLIVPDEDWLRLSPPPRVGSCTQSAEELFAQYRAQRRQDWGENSLETELEGITAAILRQRHQRPFEFLEQPSGPVRVLLVAGPAHLLPVHLGLADFSWPPEEHAVILDEWQRRHGARLVFAGGGAFELTVARPPSRLGSLRQLCREQYLYCMNIVVQGSQTLPALAQELTGDKWFFWWD
jgi:hypothetical protein